MTDEKLTALEALANGATPPPWKAMAFDGYTVHANGKRVADFDQENYHYDAIFVVHARTAVPELCAEIRRLQGEREAVLKVLRDFDDHKYPGFAGPTDALHAIRTALTPGESND